MTQEELEKLSSYYYSLLAQDSVLKERDNEQTHRNVEDKPFRMIAQEIHRIEKEFPGFLPPFNEQDFLQFPAADFGEAYYNLTALRSYLAAALARLKARLSTITTVNIPSMKVTREGVFFAGQYFDALQRVREILADAQQSITIIDGYINQDVLNLLTAKSQAVEVNILTKSVPPALSTAASAFNKQYGKLSIRISQTFHDRFVIVDDQNFYHFGASIKDLGHRGFMFSLIEEPEITKLLRERLVQEWARAQVGV